MCEVRVPPETAGCLTLFAKSRTWMKGKVYITLFIESCSKRDSGRERSEEN